MPLIPVRDSDGITIYHGDILDDLALLDQADVIVCDPPYGVRYVSNQGRWAHHPIAGDDSTAARDEVLAAWAPRPALVFGRWSEQKPPGTRQCLTWEKTLDHGGCGDLSLPWRRNTEEIYVVGKGFLPPTTAKSAVLRFRAPVNTQPKHHPTEKPVALMRELISVCPPEWVILDPFMGSGSTLRAAADMGRRAIGVEIDPAYAETAVRRLGQRSLFQAAM